MLIRCVITQVKSKCSHFLVCPMQKKNSFRIAGFFRIALPHLNCVLSEIQVRDAELVMGARP
jgi:hypothetical protein